MFPRKYGSFIDITYMKSSRRVAKCQDPEDFGSVSSLMLYGFICHNFSKAELKSSRVNCTS